MNFESIFIFCLFQISFGDHKDEFSISDGSFKMFCSRFKGLLEQQKGGMNGDKCTVGFEILTEDKEEAMNFCKLWLPYHILKAEPSVTSPNKKTSTCVAEVEQTCPYGWDLMRTRCYKLVDTRKHYTWEEAENICAKAYSGAKVIELRSKMAHIWRAFYPILTQVWVRPGQHENQFIRYDDEKLNEADKATALVYENAVSYEIRPFSLIRIGKKEKSMVICEFKPPISSVEARIIAEKWSRVYYPISVTRKYVMLRTKLHFSRVKQWADLEICMRLGSIFSVPTATGVPFLSAEQTNSISFKNFPISHSTATCVSPVCNSKATKADFYPFFGFGCVVEKVSKTCFLPNDKEYDSHESTIQSNVAVIHNEQKFRLISHAARLPLICSSGLQFYETIDSCGNGWNGFKRSSGIYFCHRVVGEYDSFYSAEERCQREFNAHLTGFDSIQEFNFLLKLAKEFKSVWIGSERRLECEWQQKRDGYGFDESSTYCNRNEVFEWKNLVANNHNKVFRVLWHTENNPSYYWRGIERCMEIMVDDKGLNDLVCQRSRPYICGKPADIKYSDV